MGKGKLKSVAEWKAEKRLKALLGGVDVNADVAIEELAKTPENGAAFYAAISAFKQKGKQKRGAAASVYAYSPEEYAQMRCFGTLSWVGVEIGKGNGPEAVIRTYALLNKGMAFPDCDPDRLPSGDEGDVRRLFPEQYECCERSRPRPRPPYPCRFATAIARSISAATAYCRVTRSSLWPSAIRATSMPCVRASSVPRACRSRCGLHRGILAASHARWMALR